MPKKNIKNLKLLIMDIEGVLTDGGMYCFEDGGIAEKFNTRDGMGVELWRNAGFKTMVITGKKLKLIENRAKGMKIDYILMGIKDKYAATKNILTKKGIRLKEAAYIGDDINDLPLLKRVGFSASVTDGIECVKKEVDYITKRKGGEGAVRELIDYLLEYKNK
jgi:N-acylneuraminate cytidylyltransferase